MVLIIANIMLLLAGTGMTVISQSHTTADFLRYSNGRDEVTALPSSVNRAPLVFPATDDVLVSQPYNHDLVADGANFSSGMDYMVADDMILSGDYAVELVDIWLKDYSGELPSAYNVGIQGDAGPGPDGQWIWQNTESNVWYEPFDIFAGDTVWHAQITLSDGPLLQGPATYWFCLQAVDPDAWTFWNCALNQPTWGEEMFFSYDSGLSWEPSYLPFGMHLGTFLIIQGTTSLERNTWAEIKTSF